MTDPIAFVLASLALLAAPGPTNTLLATSGAAAGLARSLVLVPAVVAGYLIAIVLIAVLIAPVINLSPWLDAGLRVACGAYLAWSAWRMWRRGATGGGDAGPVSAWQTFVATLLNPKGLVFALVLVPHLAEGRAAEAAPYLGALVAMIASVSLVWTGAGAMLKAAAGPGMNTLTVNRAGAGVLAAFGVMIAASTLTLGG